MSTFLDRSKPVFFPGPVLKIAMTPGVIFGGVWHRVERENPGGAPVSWVCPVGDSPRPRASFNLLNQ
eukprot:6173293-Prorocentrum_lima.AAC.1